MSGIHYKEAYLLHAQKIQEMRIQRQVLTFPLSQHCHRQFSVGAASVAAIPRNNVEVPYRFTEQIVGTNQSRDINDPDTGFSGVQIAVLAIAWTKSRQGRPVETG